MSEPSDAAPETIKTQAEVLKEEGNSLFKRGSYLKAAATYTQAIKLDPENAALYSNRSAAFLHLSKVTKALADAEMVVKLKPTWDKGHFRKGCSLEAMKKYEEALTAFREAAEHNPRSNEVQVKLKQLQRLLRDVKRSVPPDTSTRGAAANGGADHTKMQGHLALGGDPRVSAFARDMLAAAEKSWAESGGKFEASVHFLPGKPGPDGKDSLTMVAIKEAFDSPDTLQNCIGFLRQQGAELEAAAACLIVPRRVIAFPQVWRGRGELGWKFGTTDGCFVQLETKNLRNMWFLPGESNQGAASSGSPSELDGDTYSILPPLLR